jgi:hypothetical protein
MLRYTHQLSAALIGTVMVAGISFSPNESDYTPRDEGRISRHLSSVSWLTGEPVAEAAAVA